MIMYMFSSLDFFIRYVDIETVILKIRVKIAFSGDLRREGVARRL